MKTLRSPPRPEARSGSSAGPRKTWPQSEPRNGQTPPPVVMVVEDSLVVRERLGAMIRDARIPCRTIFAADGAQARAQFDDHRPAVVVLDIALPDESGLELLQTFKQRHPEAVVIILTNYAFPEFRTRAEALRCDYFFNKSVEFEKVCEVLRHRFRNPPDIPDEIGGPA